MTRNVVMPTALRCGYRVSPLGVEPDRVRFSWQLEGEDSSARQRAYQLVVRRTGTVPAADATLWDSGRVDSAESVDVAYGGSPLVAAARYCWEVRVWDSAESLSPWSAPAFFEVAKGDGAHWSAEWIGLGPGTVPHPVPSGPGLGDRELDALAPAPYFRREFALDKAIARARLTMTALGVYEATVNGGAVGEAVLAPGWTDYAKRCLYQTYDVTATLVRGANALAVTVADGWACGFYGFDPKRRGSHYATEPWLLAELVVEYEDGSEVRVPTDSSWRSATGAVVHADLLMGERREFALEPVGWRLAGYDDASWRRVETRQIGEVKLVADQGPAIVPSMDMPARTITRLSNGAVVVDFGQNLVGWVELAPHAEPGTEVTVRHGEVLNADGSLYGENLRTARATDSYVVGGEDDRLAPGFTFHGFRYAEISGWPGELAPTDVTAVVVHSDMARTGWLDTGDEMLDRLHANVVWSWRGNSLGIPTDCPQRDERMGWTGDIAAFAPTAGYLYDCAGFLASWLVDLALEQSRRGGVVPVVVPDALATSGTAAAAWGDAATLVPEALYRSFGDVTVLETQYESMRAWVEVERSRAGDDHLWTGGFQYGDWLDPSAPPEDPARAKTDPDVVASAYYYRSTSALAAAARVLGRAEEAREYELLAGRIRSAFVREYVTEAGRVLSDAHSAYALAIAFGLLDDPGRRAGAGDRLAELARAYGYRIRSGFVGTPIVCDALVATGHPWTAFRLLTETGCPSWLYPVSMGATTIWERWDSMLEDGSVNPGQMTSFNHYALGAVADWMHRAIGGIAPGSPGYRLVEISPVPGGGLRGARARLETGYGRVEVAWALAGEVLTLSAQIPANSRARVTLPGREAFEVGSGTHEWSVEVPGGGSDEAAGGTAAGAAASDALGLESSLAEIVDDGDAMAVLLAVFAELDYRPGLSWTEKGAWRSDSRLGDSLVMLPAGGRERVARALAELDVRR